MFAASLIFLRDIPSIHEIVNKAAFLKSAEIDLKDSMNN
ncbi:unnamed protein product, partial [marine sediment metagenome]